MKEVHGTLVSAFLGAPGSLKKVECDTLEFAFDGIVGDRHRGFTRAAWDLTDKQPGGTVRRNERQWSAVAHEDLAAVSAQLSLPAALRAGDVAVNLSISGVPEFSRLPRGTVLAFEGGVVLIVEEYNPPCTRMSQHIADHYHSVNDEPLGKMDFIEASKFCRGLVGAVEVPGNVSIGEGVTVRQEVLPKWLRA
jgi:MOSC domain-containing protein YiiM